MTSPFDEIASRLHGDWRALMRSRANVLVTVRRDLFEDFGLSCRGAFREPVACLRASGPLQLEPVSTLVIVDLQMLGAEGQRALAAWMSDPANADTQVIALSDQPLFNLVRSGAFDRDLYYRLNTIHLDLIDQPDAR